MVIFRIVLVLVVFALLLVLAVSEHTPDRVALFGADESRSVPVTQVMLYAFAFGAACVGVFWIVSEIQLRARLRRQQHEIDALTEELHAFRTAPLEDGPSAPKRYES